MEVEISTSCAATYREVRRGLPTVVIVGLFLAEAYGVFHAVLCF